MVHTSDPKNLAEVWVMRDGGYRRCTAKVGEIVIEVPINGFLNEFVEQSLAFCC